MYSIDASHPDESMICVDPEPSTGIRCQNVARETIMAVATGPDVRLHAFYERVEKQDLPPLWLADNAVSPRGDVRPWLWPWSVVRPNMCDASEVMPLGVDGCADRR